MQATEAYVEGERPHWRERHARDAGRALALSTVLLQSGLLKWSFALLR
jgi:hypothetical protein